MKKSILMVVAGLALALTTHAATINWASSNNAVVWKASGTTVGVAGAQFYLVLDDYVSTITDAILNDTFGTSTVGVLAMGTSSNTRGLISERSADSDLLQLGGTIYNYRLLVFDTLAGDNYYQFSASIPQTAYTAGHELDGEPKTVTFSSVHFNADNWQLVPEPTSFALLAIVVAALGLHRRFT